MQRERHLDWLVRYINANPLDLGWTAPLVEYPWSGLSALVGRDDSNEWMCSDYVRCRFGNDPRALERFVERARADRAGQDPMPSHRLDEQVFSAAASTASSPGPGVNSDADVRAVTTCIALAVGVPVGEVSTVGHLDRASAVRSIDRMQQRCERPGPTLELFRRAISILAYELDPVSTPDVGIPNPLSLGHSVPGTGCP